MYGKVHKLMMQQTVKDYIPYSWISMVLVKSQHFKARAHHYAAVAVVGPNQESGYAKQNSILFIPKWMCIIRPYEVQLFRTLLKWVNRYYHYIDWMCICLCVSSKKKDFMKCTCIHSTLWHILYAFWFFFFFLHKPLKLTFLS